MKKQPRKNISRRLDKAVPDTSVIIEGIISRQIEKRRLFVKKIIIHEAVVAELESQANKNRDTGLIGLEEIKRLRLLSRKKLFLLEFKGSRPNDFEIKFAKSGEIDSLIRDLAGKEKATLITSDFVQSKVAEAKGIPVILCRFTEQKGRKMLLEKFFDRNTASVFLKEGRRAIAIKGKPGFWKRMPVSKKEISDKEIKEVYKDIMEHSKLKANSAADREKKSGSVVIAGEYRILIARPPISDSLEIFVEKPLKKKAFFEYGLGKRATEKILGSKGLLVIGERDCGKSTFVNALANKYSDLGREVRIFQDARTVFHSKELLRYTLGGSSVSENEEILFSGRPDLIVIDELKSREDFRTFSRIMLSGCRGIAVFQSTQVSLAIQQILGKYEFICFPELIDTILLISKGSVEKVFSVVKEKSKGVQTNGGLSRILLIDADSGKIEYAGL